MIQCDFVVLIEELRLVRVLVRVQIVQLIEHLDDAAHAHPAHRNGHAQQ